MAGDTSSWVRIPCPPREVRRPRPTFATSACCRVARHHPKTVPTPPAPLMGELLPMESFAELLRLAALAEAEERGESFWTLRHPTGAGLEDRACVVRLADGARCCAASGSWSCSKCSFLSGRSVPRAKLTRRRLGGESRRTDLAMTHPRSSDASAFGVCRNRNVPEPETLNISTLSHV